MHNFVSSEMDGNAALHFNELLLRERSRIMKKLLVFAVLVLVLSFSTFSYAGTADKGAYIGIGGSVALENFEEDYDVSPGTYETLDREESWGVNAKVGYYISPSFSIELDYSYLFEFEWDQDQVDVNVMTIMPQIKGCVGTENASLFGVVGIGYMSVDVDEEILSPLTSIDKSDVCIKLGVGVDYFVIKNLSIGIEGDYVYGLGDLDKVEYWNFSLGVCYYFGM